MKDKKLEFGYYDSLIAYLSDETVQNDVADGAVIVVYANAENHAYVLEIRHPNRVEAKESLKGEKTE